MGFSVDEGLKALSTCVKASYLWRGITALHYSFILHHYFATLMQQFGVEVQRKRHHQRRVSIKLLRLTGAGLEVAGLASSSAAALVIAHFCGLEYFGLFRVHLAANNRVVLRWKEECHFVFPVWQFGSCGFIFLLYKPMFKRHIWGSSWA